VEAERIAACAVSAASPLDRYHEGATSMKLHAWGLSPTRKQVARGQNYRHRITACGVFKTEKLVTPTNKRVTCLNCRKQMAWERKQLGKNARRIAR
jgi:hypothetical protein